MDTIKEERNKFLGVVLLDALELWLEVPDSLLEGEWCYGRFYIKPHLLDEVSVLCDQLPL